MSTYRCLDVVREESASVSIWGETVVLKVISSEVLYQDLSSPGKTEDSLAIARDADEMVFFTPS